ncbi:MAG TPA: hypothetical protein PLU72_18375 [Candidatus Ozemobacteraceae bacterium]|nr:hypothetical protein [Candidatus Ozemobacteraceae bacterium]
MNMVKNTPMDKVINFKDKLKAARLKSHCADGASPSGFTGTASFFCQTDDCPAREIDILIKELDRNVNSMPRCPFCLKILATLTIE